MHRSPSRDVDAWRTIVECVRGDCATKQLT
jgi:hypothetical protein